MATLPTAIGPIGARQINRNLYVGQSDLANIQAAVNVAARIGGPFTVVIPFDYAGSDAIATLTGGNASIQILDQRNGQMQAYYWAGSFFTAQKFQQGTGFVSMAKPAPVPAGSAAFYFDPTGTSGAGTAHIDVTAATGAGMPSLNVNLVPSDGTPFVTFFRCQLGAMPGMPTQVPQIEMPSELGLFNGSTNSFNLWTGGFYIPGGKGMTIWAKADEDAIDLQGQTIGGAYDQTIRLNYLGGDVQIGPITFDAAGNIANIDTLDATYVAASDADFDTCEVDNSPVRTFANTPDGPGQGMVWPPDGIPVSLGDHWQSPSISPTSLATWPPTGIAVSTGSAWGTPIPTADVARLSAPLSSFTGALNAAWSAYAGVDITAFGLTLVRNVTNSVGETDFINNMGSGGGGFYWYNVANGAHVSSTTLPIMTLLSNGALHTNGFFSCSPNNSAGITAQNNGLTIAWNIGSGVGETDFINSTAGAGGAFFWYNAVPGAVINSTTQPMMRLDANNALSVNGDIISTQVVRSAGLSVASPSTGTAGILTGLQPNLANGNTTSVNIGAANTPGQIVEVGYQQQAGGGHGIIGMIAGGIATFDFPGNWTFPAGINAIGSLTLRSSAGGTGAVIQQSTDTNFHINAQSGGNVLLNWDVNAATFFGNGAGANVASVTSAGDAHFTSVSTSAGKAFRITHPLDEEKYLTHGSLEGPEFGVYYRGEGVTEDGRAEITLPDYFEDLTMAENRTVLLTQIYEEEDEALTLLAASRIKDGKFRVRSTSPTAKFFWEVKAVRGDIEPLIIEETKEDLRARTEPIPKPERDGETEA